MDESKASTKWSSYSQALARAYRRPLLRGNYSISEAVNELIKLTYATPKIHPAPWGVTLITPIGQIATKKSSMINWHSKSVC